MIAIHPVHRRLAELTLNSTRPLNATERMDLAHCLAVNARLVYQLDALKELSFHAHSMGDMEWQQEICKKIEELEVSLS